VSPTGDFRCVQCGQWGHTCPGGSNPSMARELGHLGNQERIAEPTAAGEQARVALAQAEAQVRAVHDGYARLVAAVQDVLAESHPAENEWVVGKLRTALAALDRSPWVVATERCSQRGSALDAETQRPDAEVAPEQAFCRPIAETPRPDALAEVPVAVEATETPEAPEARLVLEGLADWLDRYRACAPRLAAEVPGGARVEWLLPGVVFDVLLAAVKRARGGA
jgi:hypothetical protein